MVAFGVPVLSLLATYNSFRNQIGYCRLQSYDTVSRSTSGSVPMFLDGRISFGVGLSARNMDTTGANLCGMCINVTSVKNFYNWNQEITEWDAVAEYPFLAIVMDRCPDEICTENFLDFDVYSPLQPVSNGNPSHVEWYPIPCPIRADEPVEYLMCTPDTCNVGQSIDIPRRVVPYWSLTIRNVRFPIRSVSVSGSDNILHSLRLENGWVWDSDFFDLDEPFTISFEDVTGNRFQEVILIPDKGDPSYMGGYRWLSSLSTGMV